MDDLEPAPGSEGEADALLPVWSDAGGKIISLSEPLSFLSINNTHFLQCPKLNTGPST
jgi:hypothetical protein